MSASFQRGVGIPIQEMAYRRWLITRIAPADVSVSYDHVRYNLSTEGNRFVGASPEVDLAWREISYDSESTPSFTRSMLVLTALYSGRPVVVKI